jgi:gliding motility-associated-like protein
LYLSCIYHFLSKIQKRRSCCQFLIYSFLLALSPLVSAQTESKTFVYTGAVQTFTVPCTDSIIVKVWAGGGAGGGADADSGRVGGAGAYVKSTLGVVPGQILTLIVGGGAEPGANGVNGCYSAKGGGAGGWGNGMIDGGTGGKPGCIGGSGAGGGGGAGTGLYNGATVLLVAGGGGGGGGGGDNSVGGLGGGGGVDGGNSGSNWQAGTDSCTNPGLTGASGNGIGMAGSSVAGTTAGYSIDDAGAGAGGGGFLGGGGGGVVAGCDCGACGGGGGSSFSSGINTTISNGNGQVPGNSADPDLPAGVAVGGGLLSSGGNGIIIISYTLHTSSLIVSATQNSPAACGLSNGIAGVSASGGMNYTYLWSNKVNTATDPNLLPGTYTVTVSDQGGCTASSTVTIQNSKGPTVKVTDSVSTCEGTTDGAITISTTGTNLTYSWSNNSSSQNQTNLAPGIYTVTVTEASGCAATVSGTVPKLPAPAITAGRDTVIIAGGHTQLVASGGISYLWTPAGSLNNPTIYDPIADPTQTTTYTVIVTGTNDCVSSDSVKVVIAELNCDSTSIFIPNAFSPDNDDLNDVLYVRETHNCISQLTLQIYDRWGELVFETTSLSNGWDGTFRGKPMKMQVFIYFLRATLNNGQTINKRGNITLMR